MPLMTWRTPCFPCNDVRSLVILSIIDPRIEWTLYVQEPLLASSNILLADSDKFDATIPYLGGKGSSSIQAVLCHCFGGIDSKYCFPFREIFSVVVSNSAAYRCENVWDVRQLASTGSWFEYANKNSTCYNTCRPKLSTFSIFCFAFV